MKIEVRAGSPVEFDCEALATYAFLPPSSDEGEGSGKSAAPSKKGVPTSQAAKTKKRKDASRAAAEPEPTSWETSPMLDAVDAAMSGALRAQARLEEFRSKPNSLLSMNTAASLPARTVMVFGLGARKATKNHSYRSYAARAARTAQNDRATSLAIVAPDASPETIRTLAEGLELGAHRFDRYLTGDRAPKTKLEQVTIFVEGAKVAANSPALALGRAIGQAVNLTRELVAEPPNVLHAPALAAAAEKVARECGLEIQVFDKKRITAEGMRLLLAVNQGSTTEPRFVHMIYRPRGAKKGAPAPKKMAFVGKGITFDSGGLCIKPADSMVDMKTDMTGAANVIGLMAAVAALKPNVEVHGIIAATDNMPSGNAYRPGDVFRSLDGKTVEIINTDAEGRLILADALTYARNLQPDVVIDNATLTGACMVALGQYCTGFYATNDELAAQFATSVSEAGELMWRMPLLDELREQLKSDIADMKHTGSRYGGSITAALFLREFVGGLPWIHCDIAGPATSDKPMGFYGKGATGHGVLSFLRFVEQFAKA